MPPTDDLATRGEPQQDPTEDTQADGAADTDQDDAENTIDWKERYQELQSAKDRKIAELQAKLAGGPSQDDDEEDEGADDEDDDEPAESRGGDRLEEQNWALAETVFGSDAIKAYGKSATLLERAQTPADFVGAFEAYHQARLRGAAKPKRQQQAQASEPSQPVDANRSDAAPRNDLDRQAEEALARGDSRSWLTAQVKRIRGE